jgi:hypothetical protein
MCTASSYTQDTLSVERVKKESIGEKEIRWRESVEHGRFIFKLFLVVKNTFILEAFFAKN